MKVAMSRCVVDYYKKNAKVRALQKLFVLIGFCHARGA